MTYDDFVEDRLRNQFLASESTAPPAPNLAQDVIAAGRRALARRRAILVYGSAAALVAVTTLGTAVTIRLGSHDSTSNAPATAGPTVRSAQAPVSPFEWANSLEIGSRPEVAYLTGTRLHLPDVTVNLAAERAELVGSTAAGVLMLLMHGSVDSPSFSSEFALVSTGGQVSHLAPGDVRTAQGQLVSPDGAQFTNGSDIFDVRSHAPVALIPETAITVFSWTSAGITFDDRDGDYWLWNPASTNSPIRLAGHPGDYAPRSDFGIQNLRGCSAVVRLRDDGRLETTFRTCRSRLTSVSPSGQWALTADLQLIDMGTGSTQALDGANVTDLPAIADYSWVGGNVVLIAIPSLDYVNQDPAQPNPTTSSVVIRCDVVRNVCERAGSEEQVPVTQGNIGLP